MLFRRRNFNPDGRSAGMQRAVAAQSTRICTSFTICIPPPADSCRTDRGVLRHTAHRAIVR